jgi:hypothetical protein
VINEHLARSAGRYLEIGVRSGFVFWQARARAKVGVDPALVGRRLNWMSTITTLKCRLGVRTGSFLFSETSDDFFARRRPTLTRCNFDCVLVDGLHTADQAYRDVCNALEYLTPGGLIVMHDCNPKTETAALPSLAEARGRPDFDGGWNGTVWQAVVRLRTRADVVVEVIDSDEGLGLVTRGEPRDTLQLSDAEIDALTYADLRADRVRLLNLVQPPSRIDR